MKRKNGARPGRAIRLFYIAILEALAEHGGLSRRRIERTVPKERILQKLDDPPDRDHDKKHDDPPKEKRPPLLGALLVPKVRNIDRHPPKIRDEPENDQGHGRHVDEFDDIERKILERIRRGQRSEGQEEDT